MSFVAPASLFDEETQDEAAWHSEDLLRLRQGRGAGNGRIYCQFPKQGRIVRFVPSPDGNGSAYVEIEVVSGNAAYGKGDYFWLSPKKARALYEKSDEPNRLCAAPTRPLPVPQVRPEFRRWVARA
ncbi:MAG: hypothetical protein P4M13_08850 [Alphaproteobacteria bacterium]|nr:hypothetical protein [Alphaproteobacteria bacterium]